MVNAAVGEPASAARRYQPAAELLHRRQLAEMGALAQLVDRHGGPCRRIRGFVGCREGDRRCALGERGADAESGGNQQGRM